MFFIASKILAFVINPLNWILAFGIYALLTKRRNRKRKSLLFALILFVFFSNNFIANEVMKAWEIAPKSTKELSHTHYNYAIVLTGIASSVPGPDGRVHLHRGADRVLHPLSLFKQGFVDTIVISGGIGKVTESEDALPEAILLKRILLDASVPPECIIIESAARNTYENAKFSAEYIKNNNTSPTRNLVVTSAFHMRRAAACFKKQDLKFDSFPVDVYSSKRSFAPENLLLPKHDAFLKWQALLKEWVGLLAYKMSGYI